MILLSGTAVGAGNVAHIAGCCHVLFSSSKRAQLSFCFPRLPPPLTHSPNMFLVRMLAASFLTYGFAVCDALCESSPPAPKSPGWVLGSRAGAAHGLHVIAWWNQRMVESQNKQESMEFYRIME